MSEQVEVILKHEYRDEIVGVLVARLTPPTADYHHLYFTNASFTADGKDVILGSNRDGKWRLYRFEIATGRLCRLTEDEANTHGACLDPVRRIVYYFSGGQLHSVNIDSLKAQTHYETPEGFKPGILSVSSCGRYLAFVYTEVLPSSTASGRIYSGMHEYYFQRPRSVVIRLDLQTGRPSAIWGETNWISHVQISPVDSDIVMFCHEGAFLVKQRMWIVNAMTSVCRPLYDQKSNEHCSHEYFLKDGRVMSQLAVYGGDGKIFTGDRGVHYNLLTNIDNTGLTKFRLPSHAPFHIQSNSDATLHIGDCAFPTPDYPDGGRLMSLIRHIDGRAELRPFCRHDGDFSVQLGHPHPIFSPDDRYILFSSNSGGKCGVYLAEAPEDWSSED